MKSRWIPMVRVLALATVATFWAAGAQAQPGPKPPGCKDPRAIAKYLRLTAEQVEQVKVLRQDLKTAVEPLKGQIEPLQDQLATLLDATSPDACAVGAVVVDIDEIRDDIADAIDDFEADFEALLTANQLAKWNALQAVCRALGEATGG